MLSWTNTILPKIWSTFYVFNAQYFRNSGLSELYALQGQIGFSAYERLDGKLIQPDALKILQIKA
jgi:HK97 family phage major capsid protein